MPIYFSLLIFYTSVSVAFCSDPYLRLIDSLHTAAGSEWETGVLIQMHT